MTNFLPAGVINDSVTDLVTQINEARSYLEQRDIRRLRECIIELEGTIFDLALFLNKLTCQPLLYLGKGSTEEVISRLNWALAFSEDTNVQEFINIKHKNKL